MLVAAWARQAALDRAQQPFGATRGEMITRGCKRHSRHACDRQELTRPPPPPPPLLSRNHTAGAPPPTSTTHTKRMTETVGPQTDTQTHTRASSECSFWATHLCSSQQPMEQCMDAPQDQEPQPIPKVVLSQPLNRSTAQGCTRPPPALPSRGQAWLHPQQVHTNQHNHDNSSG